VEKGRIRNGKVLEERNEKGDDGREKERERNGKRDGKDINSIQHVQLRKFK